MVIQERKNCQDVAAFSTTSSSAASASDPDDGLYCPPLVAVEGRVTSVADCMPDASSVGSSYFRLKERALTRPKRDARKTIQVRTVDVQNINHEHEIGRRPVGQKCCLTDLHPSFWQLTGAPPPTFKMPTSDRAAEDARRSGRQTGRRWREDWDEVQDRLCALFEKHQFYRLVQENKAYRLPCFRISNPGAISRIIE